MKVSLWNTRPATIIIFHGNPGRDDMVAVDKAQSEGAPTFRFLKIKASATAWFKILSRLELLDTMTYSHHRATLRQSMSMRNPLSSGKIRIQLEGLQQQALLRALANLHMQTLASKWNLQRTHLTRLCKTKRRSTQSDRFSPKDHAPNLAGAGHIILTQVLARSATREMCPSDMLEPAHKGLLPREKLLIPKPRSRSYRYVKVA